MKRRTFLQSAFAAAAVASLQPHPAAATLLRFAPRLDAGIEAVTGDGRRVTLPAGDVTELQRRLHGPLLLPVDQGYEQARQILNPSFDKRPALIVQATGAADVRAAVDFARDHGGLLLAVKCGGHSFSGASTCDDGLMIDLSLFRGVRVDPIARKAWVAGGTLLGQVDHETMAHGLATPLGTVSHTGAGGLITGGGFGRLARRFGLSIDNLSGVHVVTADGQLRRANAEENPDLFWGVRGGGGNFGVVTAFELVLHPVQRQVLGGQIVFPLERARDALSVYAEYVTDAPDDLSIMLWIAQPPDGQAGAVGFDVCYSGPPEQAERALRSVRALGRPVADDVGAIDYTVLQRSGDVEDPRAQGIYLKGGLVPAIPPALIDAIVDGFEGHPERMTTLYFQEGGGAIGRVAADATAFPHRELHSNMGVVTGWNFGDDPKPHMDWARQYFTGLEHHTYGFYVNDMSPDIAAAAIQANYRHNLDRLVAVKNRYDPTNLFRLNANIQPTAQRAAAA
jgi:FAD/FMN-containing dehydrogenase